METILQALVVVGGLTFSLATALLIEELIFGQIFRVVFARNPVPRTTSLNGSGPYPSVAEIQRKN